MILYKTTFGYHTDTPVFVQFHGKKKNDTRTSTFHEIQITPRTKSQSHSVFIAVQIFVWIRGKKHEQKEDGNEKKAHKVNENRIHGRGVNVSS